MSKLLPEVRVAVRCQSRSLVSKTSEQRFVVEVAVGILVEVVVGVVVGVVVWCQSSGHTSE